MTAHKTTAAADRPLTRRRFRFFAGGTGAGPATPAAARALISGPVKITAILTARPGRADALKALLLDLMVRSRAEPGNLRWDIWQDQAESDRFLLDELYLDQAALRAHRESPHFRRYLVEVNDLAARSAFVLDPLAVRAA